ncbi:MAG: hypothetical protein J6M60_00940 [Clostridia bacterium]|nr:hypothetical protein [Clostridia bacterium]
MSKSGIVNVKMVITEEKILSNIDKVEKLINPKSKKQIVELEDDAFFKDLIESVKTYLIEYPKKKNFPPAVYKACYDLVEYATNQFEENTKQIEDLIRQREANIGMAGKLKEVLDTIVEGETGWKQTIKEAEGKIPGDIIETLELIGKAEDKEAEEYQDALKIVNAKIANLESNLHIEIDMERIEDRSKALSYIGIEIAEALKLIPAPVIEEEPKEIPMEEAVTEAPVVDENAQYLEDTRFEVKQSLWSKIKESKVGRALRYVFKIRVVLDVPALPEGRSEENK